MGELDVGARPGPPVSPLSRQRRWRREHSWISLCVVLLLIAIIPPFVNLGRFQRRISLAISHSLGRPVRMSSISLRLLPWPAFVVENLSVEEDPAFGAEPALLAPEVIVEPRLSSLWRGHFELSRVELTDASVNLVRNAQGHWSVASVLLQASRIQNAPTGQSHPGETPRFPYIDATNARINFKQGVEKLPYSLLSADFSMWLDRPGVWRLKLDGQPVRTDLDLALDDTGLVHLEGEVQRASAFGVMPLKLDGAWKHAPLGQLSRLLLGRDAGWRGDIDATGHFEGELDHLDVRTHLKIADLHRQEFTPGEPFVVDATCHGTYSRADATLDKGRCRWPLGDGALVLSGGTDAATKQPGGQLAVHAVAASFFARVLGLWHANLPRSEVFTGAAEGALTYNLATKQLGGAVSMPSLQIAEGGLDGVPLVLTDVRLTAPVVPVGTSGFQPQGLTAPETLTLAAAPVAMGVSTRPMTLSADLTGQGFVLHWDGAAALKNLQAAASALRLPAFPQLSDAPEPIGLGTEHSIAGRVQLALTARGHWRASAPDAPWADGAGTVHLENVQWAMPWLATPIVFSSLDGTLSPGMVHWNSSSVSLGDAPNQLDFSASAQVPLHCAPSTKQYPSPCEVQASLKTGALDAGSLQRALMGDRSGLVDEIVDRFNENHVRLPDFFASVHADVLTIGRLPLRNVLILLHTPQGGNASAAVAKDGRTDDELHGTGVLSIDSLDGQMLGGQLAASGTVSLAGATPSYDMHAEAVRMSAVQAAALWHESWGPGLLDGSADLMLTGTDAEALLGHAAGKFVLTWQHGNLPPVLPHFASWSGSGEVNGDGLKLTRSTLPGTAETVAGTIGWDRSLKLQVTSEPGAAIEMLGGTLAHPVAGPTGAAQ